MYQRVKINDSYNLWNPIKYGVPQGSTLCAILFNIFLCDMFFTIDIIDIASYSDDKTPFSAGKNQCDLEKKLQKSSLKLFKWFHEDGIKCHFRSSLGVKRSFRYLLAY